jgi:hypothetical protein
MMTAPKFSIVVTAPLGLEACPYLDAFTAQAGNAAIEIVVADSGKPFADRSRPGLRHVPAADAEIQVLIAAGISAARGEWILLTEDHCRPLPGLLKAYAEAIATHPDADLFAGAAVNQTSTSPWSEAVFLTGLGGQWAGRGAAITEPSNANLLVRRAALRPDELALPGGLLHRAVPRLTAGGRFAACAEALVDHVLPLSAPQAIAFQYHCARGCHQTGLAVRPQAEVSEAAGSRLWTVLRIAALDPLRSARQARGSALGRAALTLRLGVLGLTVLYAIATARMARRFGRAGGSARAHLRLAR